MTALCKYCDDPIEGAPFMCGGVIIPNASPINGATVCGECSERGQDWFHDSDMEDR